MTKETYIYRLAIVAILLLITSSSLRAQSRYRVEGVVKDKDTNERIDMAVVGIKELGIWVYSNMTGEFYINDIPLGVYTLHTSYISHKLNEEKIILNKNVYKEIFLSISDISLKEVIITAKESKSSNTSSKISKEAISHLQPSSFSELLELLPGNSSSDPHLGGVNMVSMRQVGKDVNTSLGTSFIIDGAPLSNDANLQKITGSREMHISNKSNTGLGIDMRTIPTDEIESVDIVRGIPSVRYGDLTSGLINIKRKKGASRLKLRLKADPKSKLLHIGKGFSMKDNKSLNIGFDFLDYQIDPRNELVNYKRLSSSLRFNKIFQDKICWNINLDYTGSFDNSKIDKEINYGVEDSYSSSYNNLRLNNSMKWKNTGIEYLKSIKYKTVFSYTHSQQVVDKLISMDRDIPWTTTRQEGEADGIYLPNEYQAYLKVDAKPVNFFSQLEINISIPTFIMDNKIVLGADFRYDKNFGRGEIFNPNRPAYTGASRPRSYRDVPSEQKLSFFIEDDINIPLSTHTLNIVAGLRGTNLLNLDSKYTMSNKLFLEPRINIQWKMPSISFLDKEINISINGGYGEHCKFPVLSQLYPQDIYYDLIQLNYYHQNRNYRRVNFTTHIVDPTNYQLREATNTKLELGFDIDIEANSLSVTAFRERLSSGFRLQYAHKSFTHKKYNNQSVNYATIRSKPELDDMTFNEDTNLYLYSQVGNGGLLIKEGIEYQFDFKRIKCLYTKLSINGAYFRTTYSNSQTVLSRKDIILNGESLEYVGEYEWDNGYTAEQFNTNFRFDTQVPHLGMIFSALVECQWYGAKQYIKKDARPKSYIDKYGERYPFTKESEQDYQLNWLVINYNKGTFVKETNPLAIYTNLKLTKKFNKHIEFAMYVNRVLNYLPVYKRNSFEINRRSSPYFGMEVNFRL
jgi:outer membrane receptor for ferrienterochelin and colicin